jgi:UDP-N-acetylmuramoyl-tripeptide--D-alanyl-D-alanine ligase
VVTKVGDAHSGNFKGRAQVAKEKLGVLGSLRNNGTAVLNYDDPFLRKASYKGRKIWFGLKGGDVTARDIRLGAEKTSFTLVAGGRHFKTSVRLLGVHHVCNALAAIAAAHEFGLSYEKAAKVLVAFTPVSPMRMEMKTVRGIQIVNDAYNASPDSMKAALETFSALPAKKRKVAVVGDMLELGPLAPSAHRRVLEEALEAGVDVLVLVGLEMPKAWGRLFGLVPDLELGVEVIRSSDGRRTTVRACPSAEAAGAFLKKFLCKGDVVLLKASRGVGLEKAIQSL